MQLAVCQQATLWSHKTPCLQLNSRGKGNIAHSAPLSASTFSVPGECQETLHVKNRTGKPEHTRAGPEIVLVRKTFIKISVKFRKCNLYRGQLMSSRNAVGNLLSFRSTNMQFWSSLVRVMMPF